MGPSSKPLIVSEVDLEVGHGGDDGRYSLPCSPATMVVVLALPLVALTTCLTALTVIVYAAGDGEIEIYGIRSIAPALAVAALLCSLVLLLALSCGTHRYQPGRLLRRLRWENGRYGKSQGKGNVELGRDPKLRQLHLGLRQISAPIPIPGREIHLPGNGGYIPVHVQKYSEVDEKQPQKHTVRQELADKTCQTLKTLLSLPRASSPTSSSCWFSSTEEDTAKLLAPESNMDHSEQAAAAGSNYAQEQTREKRGRDAESSQEVKRIRAMMPPPAPRPRTPPAVIYDITEVLPAPRRAHLPTMATTRMQPPSLSSVGQTRPQSRGRHGVWRASETGSPPQRQRSASGRGHDYDMSLSARPGPRSASQPSSKEPLDRTAIWKRIVTVKPGGGFSMVDPLRCHPIHSLGKPTSPVSSAAEPAESEDEAEHESDESESDEAEHESDESEHESDGETESDEAGSEDEDEDAEFETDSEDDPADPADPQPPSTSYGQIHARRDSRSPNLPLRRAASPRPGTTPARANSGGGRTAGDLRAAYQAASRDVFSRP